jgi:hypothetical protein
MAGRFFVRLMRLLTRRRRSGATTIQRGAARLRSLKALELALKSAQQRALVAVR